MEKEQIAQWTRQRPGERILEADVPLSYGVYDVVNTPSKVHFCEFLWDPTKETGVFVRLNCISTEFTPKKHGGEKGVPFRIVIETYSHGDGPPQRLHTASCQVKVFKPKGADRKHKTDREKMVKRPLSEQEKHQPSYDCTVFKENYQTPPISQLSTEASANETSQWLQQNRFGSFIRTFASFSVFRAVYLRSLTVLELLSKLTVLCSVSPFTVHDVYVDGPSGIHVLVTDEVVRNMPDESMYIMELLRGPDEEVYSLLLKSYGTNTRAT
ncbi:hypothetical protein HPB48_016011 [Haemaphysalis longicornis]|uniref:Grh/CP2 DB domain-containing protein n=1 Tax=Haemaphysalis longicornis TaxID=44386 RepID=A0A9J6G1W8_HAELO|nr:hypothetical protein HPB48_016011 [Haemaphysalis longicornis]